MRTLAEQLHVSRANVYQRVARLERDGVITGYAATVDPQTLGLGLSAYVYLDVKQHSWQALRRKVLEIPEVAGGALVSGEHDIVLHVRTTDAAALRDLVLTRLQRMPEVLSTQTVLIFEELSPDAGGQSGAPYSSNQCASGPRRVTARSRVRSARAATRVVTMSSSSPTSSVVSSPGTNVRSPRMISVIALGSGSRSSMIDTALSPDCWRHRHRQQLGVVHVQRRGLDRDLARRVRPDQAEPARDGYSDGPCSTRVHDDEDEHDVQHPLAVGDVPHHRERRQHDRHRTAQAGPGQEELRAFRVVPERQQ